MVCDRCIRVVKEELEELGLIINDIQLGTVRVANTERSLDYDAIAKVLSENGFELLIGRRARLVEKIKTAIIELIHSDELENMNINLSGYITEKVGKDYPYLSNLFSSIESITIEKYFILQKIERVKELLVYDELSLSEIAYRLGYSSVQHLSNQFKKITGLTPSYFKTLKKIKRSSLDKVA
ncbi:MAG: helix-turn-helix transcriptional regulator [FCB group bacterium]|nr:helix-turn-helix transcriptional regulator [FCB group bacterium]